MLERLEAVWLEVSDEGEDQRQPAVEGQDLVVDRQVRNVGTVETDPEGTAGLRLAPEELSEKSELVMEFHWPE